MRLIAEDLACNRGGRTLFQHLGFEVAAGQMLLVTGRNGSGKTSLLRLVAGLLRPAAGRIALEGADAEGPIANAAHLVGHLDAVKGALSAAENVAFYRALLDGKESVEGALARLGLASLGAVPAGMLSAGQRRRLALARLLVAARPLWLLDEPTTALDPEGQDTFIGIAAEHLARGGMLIVAAHGPLKLPGTSEIRLGGDEP